MPNVFSPVLPTVIGMALKTLREKALVTRFINRDFANIPAGQGDTVTVTVASPGTTNAVTPSHNQVAATGSNPIKVPVQLTEWRETSMDLTDKEAGEISAGIMPAQLAENVKALANYVNAWFYGLYWQSYGLVGTPGTIAFNAGTTADAIAVRKLLNKQLAPDDQRFAILDLEAEAKALGVPEFVRVDARGDANALKRGFLGPLVGIEWYMDQLIPRHVSTALTAGAATVNGAHAVNAGTSDLGRTGTVSIAKATNASPLVRGDILTFAGDTQQYSVQADVTLAVGNTTVSIAPALKTAKVGGEAMTLAASHTVNLAFTRDAIAFASRPLKAPDLGGPSSANEFSMVDEVTGLVLRAEIIRQHRQTKLGLDILFGGRIVRPEFIVRLAGQ
jgi:P22 coat protein - gene protein 5